MKKIFLSFLSLALMVPCLADTVPALLIQTSMSEETLSLAEISKVNYTDTEMCIAMRNGDKLTFVIDDIKGMKFAEIDDSTTRIVAGSVVKLPVKNFRLDGTRKSEKDKRKTITIIKTDKDTRKVIK